MYWNGNCDEVHVVTDNVIAALRIYFHNRENPPKQQTQLNLCIFLLSIIFGIYFVCGKR